MALPRCFVVVTALVGLASSCVEDGPPPPPIPRWEPGIAVASPREPTVRGLLDRRGIIHAHSVYSHDACDEAPVLEDGTRDLACLADFKHGLCETRQDFVMLTDHADAFREHEFPDVLLYQEELGDELVERGGGPVASWAACGGGWRTLVLAGSESGLMPVGLEGHPVPLEERDDLYGQRSAEAAAVHRQAGAIVLVAHTEDFSAEELVTLDVDGFEMFNMHANTLLNAGAALELVLRVNDEDPGLPYPDLVALLLLSEDERYLSTWGSALASGRRFVTTMGSDCHRNTFTSLLADGERVDSYRRAMSWFSNHLLVRPDDDGSWDDRHLKDALRERRLYGSFDVLGVPVGFDFHARAGDGVTEMGGEVTLSSSLQLVAKAPRVFGLDPAAEPPALVLRVLRAREGGFDEVHRVEDAEGEGAELRYAVSESGAYRVEVRMVPFHLRELLNDDAPAVLSNEYVWVYSNAIYVRGQ